MSDRIYCGHGKKVTVENNGNPFSYFKYSIPPDDIVKIVEQAGGQLATPPTDWANINIKAKPTPEEGGPTHYGEIDTWKPNQ